MTAETALLVADAPRTISVDVDRSDLLFRRILRGTGIFVLAVMSMIGIFLALRAVQALELVGFGFLTTAAWEPDAGNFGIAAVLTGTVLIGLVAVAFALPLAVGTALYISEYAPRRLKRTLITLVDLMAAVPSVVYGLWGFFFLQNEFTGLARWISTYLGWLPFLSVEGVDPNDPLATVTAYTSSTFIAGLVVALMVTPIACSVMRESFAQAPLGEREGAYALVIVTHNMQQAQRVSDTCAFFLAEAGTPGVIVEHGPTSLVFGSPQDPRTSDYVQGRFG